MAAGLCSNGKRGTKKPRAKSEQAGILVTCCFHYITLWSSVFLFLLYFYYYSNSNKSLKGRRNSSSSNSGALLLLLLLSSILQKECSLRALYSLIHLDYSRDFPLFFSLSLSFLQKKNKYGQAALTHAYIHKTRGSNSRDSK
jgi:hypothetical protein